MATCATDFPPDSMMLKVFVAIRRLKKKIRQHESVLDLEITRACENQLSIVFDIGMETLKAAWMNLEDNEVNELADSLRDCGEEMKSNGFCPYGSMKKEQILCDKYKERMSKRCESSFADTDEQLAELIKIFIEDPDLLGMIQAKDMLGEIPPGANKLVQKELGKMPASYHQKQPEQAAASPEKQTESQQEQTAAPSLKH